MNFFGKNCTVKKFALWQRLCRLSQIHTSFFIKILKNNHTVSIRVVHFQVLFSISFCHLKIVCEIEKKKSLQDLHDIKKYLGFATRHYEDFNSTFITLFLLYVILLTPLRVARFFYKVYSFVLVVRKMAACGTDVSVWASRKVWNLEVWEAKKTHGKVMNW